MSANPIVDSAFGIAVENPIDTFLTSLNGNPYFIGLMMIIMNMGGRFFAMEMTKGQEAFFHNPWIRRSLIYVIVFMGTRNVMVSFLLGSALIFILGYLLNESSSLCIWKIGVPGSTCAETFSDRENEEEKEQEQTQPQPPLMTQPVGGQPPGLQPTGGLTPEEANILQTLQAKAAGGGIQGGGYPVQPPLPRAAEVVVPPKKNFIQRYVENMRRINQ